MDVKNLYMENSEWLEQKAKVVELERRLAALEVLVKRCERAHELAKIKLSSIERDIREEYNMKVMSSIYSEPLDDYYYERKLNQDRFIRGHKL